MKRTILAVALAALTLGAAGSAQAKHLDSQRLVVRGTDTVVDHPCPGGLCIEQTDASFRGTLGTGAYAKARGHGIGTFLEDANDREQLTLIGRIAK